MVSSAGSYGRESQFSMQESLSPIQIAPQLSSGGSLDPIPDTLLVTKCGSFGNRTRNIWIFDLWTGEIEDRNFRNIFICDHFQKL
jgi:hypothetical protein